jgi:hypothetical protein
MLFRGVAGRADRIWGKEGEVIKVQICLPVYNEIHPGCIRGLKECLKSDPASGVEFHLNMIQTSNVMYARNFLLNAGKSIAVKQEPIPGFHYFLFVDSDIEFTKAQVMKLLSHRAPVVSGLYFEKEIPDKAVAGFWETTHEAPGDPVFGVKGQTLAKGVKGMAAVDFVGAGFLLIAREVLCDLPYPWFHQDIIYGTDGADNDGARIIGEDFGFCLRLGEANVEILVDCDVVLRHHPTRLPDFYDAFRYLSNIKLGRETPAPVEGW